ncbi:MAG: cytochrome c biogenesis protein CcsA [Gemmatimonadetes bacterium]|nr:cytochrome c biogenesis protein CcsA [Gemmatimonadota bacterium]
MIPLVIATAAAFLVALGAIALYAPLEAVQGVAQKIFYIHVPLAWCAFVAVGVLLVSSLRFLRRSEPRHDRLARAAAEVGIVFATLVLVTGSLWGKAVWGTWWTWDGRLTSTLVLWFLLAGYVLLRSLSEGPPARTARAAAVLGVIAAVDIPIIHLSVQWWRTLHPDPVVLRAGDIGGGLTPRMLTTLSISLAAFSLLLVTLIALRRRIAEAEDEVEALWHLPGRGDLAA